MLELVAKTPHVFTAAEFVTLDTGSRTERGSRTSRCGTSSATRRWKISSFPTAASLRKASRSWCSASKSPSRISCWTTFPVSQESLAGRNAVDRRPYRRSG